MDIKKYTSYFHDGIIYQIEHRNKNIDILMESAEMDNDDLIDDAIFSSNKQMKTIVGMLHIENIQSISENEKKFLNIYKMKYEGAKIFDFILNSKQVLLNIVWRSYPPNPPVNDFSSIIIEAEKIWWENRPDLVL